MNKKIITKYIEGNASREEAEAVQSWVGKSEANRKYFNFQYNLESLQPLNIKINPDFQAVKDALPKQFSWTNTLQRVAAVLFIPLLAGTIFLLQSRSKPVEPVANAQVEMTTFAGVKGKVVLPDGSIVWLNSNSIIQYPVKFMDKTRDVFLSGEAYFEVTGNPDWPMIVSTPNAVRVEVKGTRFNLSAYDNDQTVTASLFEGEINISNGKINNKPIRMKPNEVVVVSEKSGEPSFSKVTDVTDVAKYIAWKEGTLIFDNTPLAEVKKILERWHGVKINISDDLINDYHFTAKFSSESIVQVMELLQKTSPITYEIIDNQVIIAKK